MKVSGTKQKGGSVVGAAPVWRNGVVRYHLGLPVTKPDGQLGVPV